MKWLPENRRNAESLLQLSLIHIFVAQAMWSADDSPSYRGSIGKLLDIHDSRTKMEELEKRASRDMLTELLDHASVKELI